jgi:hypothetical protein
LSAELWAAGHGSAISLTDMSVRRSFSRSLKAQKDRFKAPSFEKRNNFLSPAFIA